MLISDILSSIHILRWSIVQLYRYFAINVKIISAVWQFIKNQYNDIIRISTYRKGRYTEITKHRNYDKMLQDRRSCNTCRYYNYNPEMVYRKFR